MSFLAAKKYELIIIGAGSVAFDGLREAQDHGVKNILMIEKERVGGTCLNWG